MPNKDLEITIREKLLDMPGSSFRTLSAVIKAPRSSVWDALLRMQKRQAPTAARPSLRLLRTWGVQLIPRSLGCGQETVTTRSFRRNIRKAVERV